MMKNISEKTLKTMLVNLKCVGKFGKCIMHFPLAERNRAIDMLIERGWVTSQMTLTSAGNEIAIANLNLLQH